MHVFLLIISFTIQLLWGYKDTEEVFSHEKVLLRKVTLEDPGRTPEVQSLPFYSGPSSAVTAEAGEGRRGPGGMCVVDQSAARPKEEEGTCFQAREKPDRASADRPKVSGHPDKKRARTGGGFSPVEGFTKPSTSASSTAIILGQMRQGREGLPGKIFLPPPINNACQI